MSVTLVLIPVAIAIAGTLSTRDAKFKDIETLYLPTQMKDESLLQKALGNYGYKSFSDGQSINLEESQIVFQRNEQGNFDTIFLGDIPEEHAQSFVSDIYDEYTKLVQEQVYNKLLANIEERNLRLESEEVQKDNSIVLTLAIEEARN